MSANLIDGSCAFFRSAIKYFTASISVPLPSSMVCASANCRAASVKATRTGCRMATASLVEAACLGVKVPTCATPLPNSSINSSACFERCSSLPLSRAVAVIRQQVAPRSAVGAAVNRDFHALAFHNLDRASLSNFWVACHVSNYICHARPFFGIYPGKIYVFKSRRPPILLFGRFSNTVPSPSQELRSTGGNPNF